MTMQAFKLNIIFYRLTYQMLLKTFVTRVISKTEPHGEFNDAGQDD